MADTVVILEPGDVRALKIAKAMSSQTANDILNLLSEGQKSQTEIKERLNIPFNTVQYHIESLLETGLVAVSDMKYSIKGREVKYYELKNQLLIVAPKQANVRSMLVKYTTMFGIILFGALAITLVSPLFTVQNDMRSTAPMAAAPDAGVWATKMTYGEVASTSATGAPDIAIAFFIGGAFVICVLLCYELYLWKKQS
jgi:DNA-binding transcriptional ArsR family regulator